MIHIPTGFTSWVNRAGSVLKEVTCEACGQEYVYLYQKRERITWRFSLFHDNKMAWQHAGLQADRRLADALSQSCGEVPCPHCGWVQTHMFGAARRKKATYPVCAGLFLLAVSGFVIFCMALATIYPTTPTSQPGYLIRYGLPAIATLLAALAMLGCAWRDAHWWDPNSASVEARLKRAAKVAVTKDAYLELLKANEE
jgi:hypothetical protein